MLEIERLADMLTKAGVPFERNDAEEEKKFASIGDRYMRRIAYPSKKDRICSAIQGFGSYGEKQNLIEIMGILTEHGNAGDVEGCLTAKDVFTRIKKHWDTYKEANND